MIRLRLSVLLLLGAGSGAGLADDEVVVSANRSEVLSFYAPAAINAVNAEEIQAAGPRVNISESLVRLPGVFALERQNYAQDLQLSIRGFGARSTFGLRGIRLLADGIPATMPDGQGQVSAIDLAGAERIEVLRGPLAQLYGNAAGGVIQTFTGIGGPDLVEGSADFGSYGTERYGLRVRGEEGALQGAAALSDFRTDGYRDHSAAERKLFNAKLRFTASPVARFTLVGSVFDQPNADDPTGLTRDDYEHRPRSAVPIAIEQDARKSVRQEQAGVIAEIDPARAQRITARVYYGQRDLFQALALPLSAQSSPTSSGGIVDLEREYGGIGLQYAHRGLLADESLSFIAGIDIDGLQERRRGFVNEGGDRGALKRDEDDTVSNTDLYAQLSWRLAEEWTALAGVRSSLVRFRIDDRFIATGNADDSGDLRYSATNPVAGIAYQPTEALNLYANYGHGFETPSFAELAYRSSGAGVNLDLDAARSKHAEIGLKYRPAPDQRLDLALFHVTTRDEIVVDSNVGGRSTYRNADRTRRQGLELLYAGRLSSAFSAHVAWTLLDARFAGESATDGNRLPGTPKQQLFAALDWRPVPDGALAGIEVVHTGRIEVDDTNTDSAESSTRLNLRAEVKHRYAGITLTGYARLNNVTDERYAGSVIVNQSAGRFFEPAPERNWTLGVVAQFPL